MTTKDQNIQYQLNAWCKEYGIDHSKVIFQGWENMNEKGSWVLGRCRYYPDWCSIRLGDSFKAKPLGWLETSVLWHEYCHAECYLEDMKSNGHDSEWKAKKNRKMKYVIGDAIAKLIYPIL